MGQIAAGWGSPSVHARAGGRCAYAPRGLEYPAGLDCCYSYQTTSLALACWACKRRTTSHLAGLWLAGKAAGFRAGEPGRTSDPDPVLERAAVSPGGRVPCEGCCSRRAVRLWWAPHALGAGPFSVWRADSAANLGLRGHGRSAPARAPGLGGGLDPWRSHQRRTPYQRSDPRTRSAARWP